MKSTSRALLDATGHRWQHTCVSASRHEWTHGDRTVVYYGGSYSIDGHGGYTRGEMIGEISRVCVPCVPATVVGAAP